MNEANTTQALADRQAITELIDLDGDRAGSESYVTASLRRMNGEQLMQMTVWGRYIDSWSRRAGRWVLDRRSFTCDFDEMRDVREMARHETSKRDNSDPSYAVLRSPS